MGLLEKAILASLPAIPRPIMRRLASRYIAGETLEEAVARLRQLAGDGYPGVLDILGEDVANAAQARTALEEYKVGSTAVSEAGLDCYVSVKPTHFGLRISRELALELYSELAEHCRERKQFLRVEMEDHTTTDSTLELFRELRARFDHVGIVLQSRLFRTPRDIDELPDAVVDVRMVKGIYLEPAEIAHTKPEAIRDAFVECVERLFQRGHRVAFATHDEHMAARCLRVCADRGVARERYCFEVLLGVQERLWGLWKARGYRVLVYVPFGPQWRAYSTRRLKKNPEILRHVMRNALRF